MLIRFLGANYLFSILLLVGCNSGSLLVTDDRFVEEVERNNVEQVVIRQDGYALAELKSGPDDLGGVSEITTHWPLSDELRTELHDLLDEHRVRYRYLDSNAQQ